MCAMELSRGDRIYRIKRSSRRNAIIFLVLCALWAAIRWNPVSSAVLFVFAAYVSSDAFRTAITLTDNAIELRTIFTRKRLRFNEIKGRREYTAIGKYGAIRGWKIVPNNDGLPTLKFDRNLELDDAFHAWFDQLPDLDETNTLKKQNSSP
jgi:hypothetical protein